MRMNVCYKIVVYILFSCLFFSAKIPDVFAGNTAGSYGATHNNCAGCAWTYQNKGIRLSLYKYNGSNITYYGSVDFCSTTYFNGVLSCPSTGDYARQHEKKVGKVAYQNLSDYRASVDVWSQNAMYIETANYYQFPNYFQGEENVGNWDAIEASVEELFRLETKINTTIYDKIDSVFSISSRGVTVADLATLYITVEPTLNIGNSSGQRFYGTAYELAEYFQDGQDLTNSLNGVIYYQLPESIIARTTVGRDKYSFVGNLVALVPNTTLNHSVWEASADPVQARRTNAEKIISTAGYGINVFWFGNYITTEEIPSCTITESSDRSTYTLNVSNPSNSTIYYDIKASASDLNHYARNTTYTATFRDQSVIGKIYNSNGQEVATCSKDRSIPTCEQTCTGKSGDDLLGCAENYCQAMSTNSSQKRTCITTCGPNAPRDPEFTTCPSTDTNNGSDTECNASTTAYKETCTQATTSTYYKTECYERSTINYSNSLPVVLSPGEGFSYTPVLSGGKACEMTFEANKWKFDYAASYTDRERNTLVSILNKYNDVDQNSIWTQDLRDNYKYTSSNADIKIEITNDNDASAANRKTTKTLIPDETVNLLSNEIVVSSAGSITIPLFNSGRTTKTVFQLVKTTSSNKTSYKLPGTCMSAGDGTLYDLGPNGTCDTDNDGPYYQYFTDMRIENDTYDTKVTVSKGSSSLNVNNTCYYNTGIPISCSIAKVSNDKYELRIENKNMVSNVTYGLSTNKDSLNMQLTYSGSIIGGISLYGTVAVNGEKVATCELGSEDGSGSTCTSEYLPTDYSGIRKYCSTSWMSDTAGYSSEKDCINSCSIGANTCKNNPDVDTTDLTSVTNFCSVKANRDANGYNKATYSNSLMNEKHNIAMCINDCIDIPNTCTGITCDYLYRPISLVDPFPNNRRPGANWYGKEIYITDDLLNPVLNPSGAEPEYVITLTPSAINSINRDTDEYNSRSGKNAYLDYVYEDEDNKEGKYVSKFIHSTDEPNGGFRTYFSKIIGR